MKYTFKNIDKILVISFVILSFSNQAAKAEPFNETVAGTTSLKLLFYGKAEYATDFSVVKNPYITGGFFQIIWSEIEKADGQYDWSTIDSWIKPWKDAGKKVALRVMWSTSGYWPESYYKQPTPQWVWIKGATFAYDTPSQTEIPLIWDPIYEKYAFRFLREIAQKYDNDTTIMFIDVTPGAETNPYRSGTIDANDPTFATRFVNMAASDGTKFSEQLWFTSIFQWIDSTKVIFNRLPLLVTLNVGNISGGQSQLNNNGNYLVSKNYYVGQNGIKGKTPALANFIGWSNQTKVFFEMAAQSGGTEGTLMEVMQAAEKNNASYLNVYPQDVRAGTMGLPEYQKSFEDALIYGANVVVNTSTDLRPVVIDANIVKTVFYNINGTLTGEKFNLLKKGVYIKETTYDSGDVIISKFLKLID